MFKKKTTLPARPAMLIKEEIIEDLSNAPSDDVVFESDADEMKYSVENSDSALNNDSKLNTPDKSYLMPKPKRTQNASERQKETMINFMMRNEDLRSGKLTASFTRQDRKRKYKEMAKLLNDIPNGAKKSISQWIKCWNDQKAHSRGKGAAFTKELHATEGCKNSIELTSTDETILGTEGIVSALGNPDIEEGGFSACWNDQNGQAQSKGAAFNKDLHATEGGKNPIELMSTDETILGIEETVSALGNPDIDEGGFSAQSPSATSLSEEEREFQATSSTSAARKPQGKKRAFRDRRKALPRTEAYAEEMRRILEDQSVVLRQMHQEMKKQTAAMSSIASSLEIIANKLN